MFFEIEMLYDFEESSKGNRNRMKTRQSERYLDSIKLFRQENIIDIILLVQIMES